MLNIDFKHFIATKIQVKVNTDRIYHLILTIFTISLDIHFMELTLKVRPGPVVG